MIESNTKPLKLPHPYPCLRVIREGTPGRDTIVLFVSSGCGTIVHATGGYAVGAYSNCWDMNIFTNYHGTLTLNNKYEDITKKGEKTICR